MKADIKAVDDKQVLLQKDMIEVKAELTVMKADIGRLASDITEMKTDIKTTDGRLRSIDRNVARIDGFLRGRIPDFIQEPDRETTAETEQVGEVVGDQSHAIDYHLGITQNPREASRRRGFSFCGAGNFFAPFVS